MARSLKEKAWMLLDLPAAWPDIKRLLRRRLVRHRDRFELRVDGLAVDYATKDFYSKMWFHDKKWGDADFYEPAAVRNLIALAKRHNCFADVGANLGYFTMIAAKVMAPRPIYAFEMDPTLAPVFEDNVLINDLTNITLTSAPVGDDKRTIEFIPHPFSFLARLSGIDVEPFRIRLTAESIRLDDFFADKPVKPDLIKMDVDGAEMAALRGMENLLANQSLEMMLEIHPRFLPRFGSSADEVVRHLWDRGFKLFLFEGFRRSADGKMHVLQSADELKSKSGDMVLVSRKDL